MGTQIDQMIEGVLPDEDVLLDEVDFARRGLKDSKDRYLSAVLAAHGAGVSNIRIASRAGVSETAIRAMIKASKARQQQ